MQNGCNVSEQMIVIDGSQGEGGGQVLRTAVGLAAALGRAVKVERIRARRPKPGLRPQHLAAVRAAAAVCDAGPLDAEVGSTELVLRPGEVRAGEYRFDIGTAGSTTLVLQTVLPALLLAEGDSQVTVTGGTHNPLAPCFEYLRDVFALPAAAMNCQLYLEMPRAGFYPKGGGEVRLNVRGVGSPDNLDPLLLGRRAALRHIEGISAASRSLPAHIIERQTSQVLGRLASAGHRASVEQAGWPTHSPGTAVFLRATFANTVGGCFALGKRGKPAERVADEAVDALLAFIASPAALDAHAADQLLTLAALCPRESRFSTERVTDHLRTNAAVIEQTTGRSVHIEKGEGPSATVTVTEARPA